MVCACWNNNGATVITGEVKANGNTTAMTHKTSAAIKKSQKVDDKHVNKAIKFKSQYFQSVKDGTLVLLEEN